MEWGLTLWIAVSRFCMASSVSASTAAAANFSILLILKGILRPISLPLTPLIPASVARSGYGLKVDPKASMIRSLGLDGLAPLVLPTAGRAARPGLACFHTVVHQVTDMGRRPSGWAPDSRTPDKTALMNFMMTCRSMMCSAFKPSYRALATSPEGRANTFKTLLLQ